MDESLYPRPQFRRKDWLSLDGSWRFSTTRASNIADVQWTHSIEVPYPPEAPLSGIGDTAYHPVVWYQRQFTLPQAWHGQRTVIHFGAVDYRAQVWLNGHLVAEHEGGHTPFKADVTHALQEGEQTITVRAEDDPHDMHKPRGKQDWLAEAHRIWYPRTSGIWQSVWLEPVSETHIQKVRFTPNLEAFAIDLEVLVSGAVDPKNENVSLKLLLKLGDEVLVRDTLKPQGSSIKRRLHLPDPGIDDARHRFLWSPEHPHLIDVELTLSENGAVMDSVQAYTALRTVEARDGRFYLNGRPYFLRLVLDQGYWQESLMTAPDAQALKRDVELAKAMGFNGVRKHQKIEDPRFLYWADTLGLLVWEELPSAYAFSAEAVTRLTREWLEAIDRDYNHPCVVAWVPFNESWGVPDLPLSEAQQHAVAALYHLARALDPTRPAVGNDGWEHVVTDLLTIHDYTSDPEVIRSRYASREACAATTRTFLPGGRSILLPNTEVTDQPYILSEFGGVRFSSEAQGWGYDEVASPEGLLEKYRELITGASGAGLAGFCYTQFTDTFQEQNGLLYMNREPKVALEELAAATKQRVR